MQCWKPVWAMKNTNLKVTDGKRIMMDPVNNNFLSCNFFWLWHYAASWKAELISGLYHGCSVWCEIRSYRSMLLILDAWLDSPEMILHWLFFQCLHWLPGAGCGPQALQRACSSACQQPAQRCWAMPKCFGGQILCDLAGTTQKTACAESPSRSRLVLSQRGRTPAKPVPGP